MVDSAKRNEKGMIITSVISLILGVALIIWPDSVIKIITSIIGLLLSAFGVFEIVSYIRETKLDKMKNLSFTFGIVLLAIGIFLILCTDALEQVVTGILGAVICIKSVVKIQYALNLRGISDKWKYNLISGLIFLTLGIVIIIFYKQIVNTILIILGIILVVLSIIDIIETSMVLKTLDKVDYKEIPFEEKKKEIKEDKEEEK